MILFDNGHGCDTAGKCSPDGVLKEYAYTREIAKLVIQGLKDKGYECEAIVTEEYDVALDERVRRVNEYCKKYGSSNVVLVSIHCNASGMGTRWMYARGVCVYTSKGETKSDELATMFCEEAEKNFKGHNIRKDYSDGDADWEANFAVLKKTKCPAILTENFFMDNKKDVLYLLSKKGKDAIVKTHIDAIVRYAEKYLV